MSWCPTLPKTWCGSQRPASWRSTRGHRRSTAPVVTACSPAFSSWPVGGRTGSYWRTSCCAPPARRTRRTPIARNRVVPPVICAGLPGLARPRRDLSFLVGAGSVYSTPRDVHAIIRHLTSGLYGETARAALVRENRIRWNGITDGFRAFADWDAATDISVIFAGNLFAGAADLVRRDLPRIARGEDVSLPIVPKPTLRPMTRPARARFTSASFDVGSPQSVVFESDSVAAFGSWLLFVTSDSTFYSPQDYATVGVVVGANGEIEALQWGEGPRFTRVKAR